MSIPTRETGDASAIVPLQEAGYRLPLFLAPGLGGEIDAFRNLSHWLGNDQPVFALQPQDPAEPNKTLTRVEDIAAHYLREIRRVQTRGPYCLAGYSFGGYVVFEMAQQLLAAGEMVAFLAFLDTIEWQYLERLRHSANFRQRWGLRLRRVMRGRGAYLRMAVTSKATRIMHVCFRHFGRPVPQRVSTLEDINLFAMSGYQPSPYAGELTIFRTVTRRGLGAIPEDDEMLGWGSMALGGIEVQDVKGSHQNMLCEPNVRFLAEKLRLCLDRVHVPQ